MSSSLLPWETCWIKLAREEVPDSSDDTWALGTVLRWSLGDGLQSPFRCGGGRGGGGGFRLVEDSNAVALPTLARAAAIIAALDLAECGRFNAGRLETGAFTGLAAVAAVVPDRTFPELSPLAVLWTKLALAFVGGRGGSEPALDKASEGPLLPETGFSRAAKSFWRSKISFSFADDILTRLPYAEGVAARKVLPVVVVTVHVV
jgi:hypothetical protein